MWYWDHFNEIFLGEIPKAYYWSKLFYNFSNVQNNSGTITIIKRNIQLLKSVYAPSVLGPLIKKAGGVF